jgi:hypothetical protein
MTERERARIMGNLIGRRYILDAPYISSILKTKLQEYFCLEDSGGTELVGGAIGKDWNRINWGLHGGLAMEKEPPQERSHRGGYAAGKEP